MFNKTNAFRVVLVALLLAALACSAVTNALGGDSRGQDAQATLDAASTEAAKLLEDFATPEDEQPTEDSGDVITDEEPTETTTTNTTGGPEDIPVLEGANENFFASAEVVTYFSPATYDELVTFYKEQMPANGWELDASLSVEFGGTAVLTYKKDGRTATVAITPDTSSGKVIVAVAIAVQ